MFSKRLFESSRKISRFGLPQPPAHASVMKEALGLYQETEQAHQALGNHRPELRPTLNGELRSLRAIHQGDHRGHVPPSRRLTGS
ncbi:hypothetical protein [Stutzerimonas nitrititolerans]|uniref:hypothetical protein n=1 Tax=Stutzerimonas nitrititolerans TaxID=2482751 RepID=UPI00289F9459|nr:hypothetical protein [Stutzerimonas nitrititolerans]